MSKLNPKSTAILSIDAVAAQRGVALAASANGNIQFVKDDMSRLYEIAVATLMGGGRQGAQEATVGEIRSLLQRIVANGKCDFIANLIIHARSELNIRTIPIVLTVEFAQALRVAKMTYANMRRLVCDVIQRADQITDLYAYALEVFGGKGGVPMAVKRGVADAFNKFGAYQLAKYNRKAGVTLKDVLRIVHPKASSDDQRTAFAQLCSDTLPTPITWETQLSANGQKPAAERESPADIWTRLVLNGNLPYMATLRNMRNMHHAGISADAHRAVIDKIANPAEVARSRQLPFDFIQAHAELAPLDKTFAAAISDALNHSVSNLPVIGKRLWIIVDFSGSMGYISTPESAYNTALTLAAAAAASAEQYDNVAITLFGSEATTVSPPEGITSIIELREWLNTHRTGSISGSTEFRAAIKQLPKLGFDPDAVLVLSDGEYNRFPYEEMSCLKTALTKVVVNLSQSYTTAHHHSDGWQAVAGWSPAMFKWIAASKNADTAIAQLNTPYASTRGTAVKL